MYLPERHDLRKLSSQSDGIQRPAAAASNKSAKRKDKKNSTSGGSILTSKSSSKSQKSEVSSSSQGQSAATEATTTRRGSIDSFVTAYSESSLCTQDDTDDETAQQQHVAPRRNGDVTKSGPIIGGGGSGPVVSFRNHNDVTIQLGSRELDEYRNHVNRLELSYLDDSLHFDDRNEPEKITVPISVCLVIIAGYIFAGSMLFTLWEDWDYITGSSFCFITLSTIGFGDIVPGMGMDAWASHQKLVLCALWLAFGLSLIAMCFNLMQEEVKEKVKWLGHKIGLLKTDEP